MSSINTNNGAMIALQALKSINQNLGKTQSEISTGKSIATAKDNSAVWAISKQMESDVQGFKAIQSSLNLGESTVSVAGKASETITDLLTKIKGKIVAAQEQNVDRSKIQTDITALRDQIGSVVGAAQFNGLNLIDGSSTEAVSVLASLDRSANGSVTSGKISVGRQNLSVTAPANAGTFGAGAVVTADVPGIMTAGAPANVVGTAPAPGTALPGAIIDGGSQNFTIASVSEGMSYQIVLGDVEVNVAGGGTTTGSRTFEYVAGASDGAAEVAANLRSQISAFFGAATGTNGTGAPDYTVAPVVGDASSFTISNASGTDMGFSGLVQTGGTPGTTASTGGLGALATLDVTTDSGATGALAAIEGLINQSIDAAAAFGSAQGRIKTQSNFISSLSDSLTSGIGSLVDANMEEASARLQALQVQQQLATQSLSIANQAPQSILSLFR